MTTKEIIEYYINLPVGKEYKEQRAKKSREKKKANEIEFTVTFADDRDFIIEKREGEKVSSFVFLYPEMVIKHGNGTITEASQANVAAFLKGKDSSYESVSINNNLIEVFDINSFRKLQMFKTSSDIEEFFNERLASINYFENIIKAKSKTSDTYNNEIYRSEFLKELAKSTPVMKGQSKYDDRFIQIAGFLNAKNKRFFHDFCEKYLKSSMSGINILLSENISSSYFRYSTYNSITIDKMGNFMDIVRDKPDALLSYLCFDLYRQGYKTIPLRDYVIYINSAVDFYGTDFFENNALLFPKSFKRSQSIIGTYKDILETKIHKVQTTFYETYQTKDLDELLNIFTDQHFCRIDNTGKVILIKNRFTDNVEMIVSATFKSMIGPRQILLTGIVGGSRINLNNEELNILRLIGAELKKAYSEHEILLPQAA